ncbi:hypothetical protein CISIN_1g0068982mg, partial [Citrus sinensis]
MIAWQQSN